MGKRSRFERNPRDLYVTPYSCVIPLLPHLLPNTKFSEPCCGNMALVRHLERNGHTCTWASDVEPEHEPENIQGVMTQVTGTKIDAMELFAPLQQSECIITNTPWDREILHPMIAHFRALAPAWLLLDADWAFTVQAAPYMKYCSTVVAVGRVKWIPDSKHSSKDSAAWYRFEQRPCDTRLIGRQVIS